MNTSATDTLSQTLCKFTPLTAVLGVQVLFVAMVLVTGVGGLSVGSADRALKSISLAGILDVVTNPVLPGRVSSKELS